MWIALGVGIPVFILAIAVAVWPVMSRSYRYHRWEHRHGERHGRPIRRSHVRTDCQWCAAYFEAPTGGEAVAAKNEHVLSSHAQSGSEAVPATTAMTRGA